MSKLKETVEKVHKVDYGDFEEFVREIYKCPDYEFVDAFCDLAEKLGGKKENVRFVIVRPIPKEGRFKAFFRSLFRKET